MVRLFFCFELKKIGDFVKYRTNERVYPRKKNKKKRRINNATYINQDLKEYYNNETLIKKIKTCIPLSKSDEVQLNNFLKKNNYFRFSIYIKSMKSIPNVQIKDIIDTYYLDDFIRKELDIFLNFFELTWTTTLIDVLCENYKANNVYPTSQCYLDYSLYGNHEWAIKIQQSFDNTLRDNNSWAFKHHKKNKNDCLPIWVLFEEITFGQLTTFITQLHPTYYNLWINSYYKNPQYKKTMKSWATLIRYYRNKCAHHSRIYDFKATDIPAIIKTDRKYYFPDHKLQQEQSSLLYGLLYAIKHLLIYEDTYLQNKWNQFIRELHLKIKSINKIDISKYGLSEDFFKKLQIIIIH